VQHCDFVQAVCYLTPLLPRPQDLFTPR
jgi:hypothetical protein